MCVITDKIKFCTCVDAGIGIEDLNHYWVLNRYNEHKNLNIIGEAVVPFNKFTDNYKENQLMIANVLEDKEAFDKPINFQEKDRLQIVLNNQSKNSDIKMVFEFEYTSEKWESTFEDPLYLFDFFNEMGFGVIEGVEQ